jgi:hypothetical protein
MKYEKTYTNGGEFRNFALVYFVFVLITSLISLGSVLLVEENGVSQNIV